MQLADVDIYNPDNFVASVPHDMFTTLRREAPVYRHPKPDGGHFWCVTRHADLVHVNRDAATFSSYEGGTNIDVPADSLTDLRLMMLNMDPPDHTKLRKLVNKGFTPNMIRSLMAHLEEEARALVSAAVEKSDIEFVTDVACELPLIAIAEFLGVPRQDRKILFDLSNRLIGLEDPDFRRSAEDSGEAAAAMYAYAQQLADERRRNPKDDIVTTLLEAEVDGDRLDELEFNLFFMLLAVAGNETTRNAISHGAHALMTNPDQLQLLRDDPSLIDTAVEEMIRWASPVMNFRRTTMADTSLAGVDIPAGEAVVMWHISANRDETVFDNPFDFDVRRSPNVHTAHVGFGGGGPHFCLGANLARAEIKVVFQELLRQAGSWELVAEPRRLRSNFINGIKEMPARLVA